MIFRTGRLKTIHGKRITILLELYATIDNILPLWM